MFVALHRATASHLRVEDHIDAHDFTVRELGCHDDLGHELGLGREAFVQQGRVEGPLLPIAVHKDAHARHARQDDAELEGRGVFGDADRGARGVQLLARRNGGLGAGELDVAHLGTRQRLERLWVDEEQRKSHCRESECMRTAASSTLGRQAGRHKASTDPRGCPPR